MTNPQKIEGGWEEQRSKLLEDFFVEVEPNNKAGEFIVDGQWYAPKFGCDTLEMVVDEVEYLLASERQRCVEEGEKQYRYTIETLETQNKRLLEMLQLKHLSEPIVFQVSDQAKHNLEQMI